MKLWFSALLLLFAAACGEAPKLPEIPGVKGPLFHLVDGKVMITVKLLNAQFHHGGRLPIPKTRASYFELSSNLEDGGSLLVFSLDVADLQNMNIGIGEGNTLPDGRAIPGVAGGVLTQSLRVDTELLDMSFYFSKTLFGFFIPIGWNTNGFGGSWSVVINQKNVGILGAVPSDDHGKGAGVMLFLRLGQLQDPQIKKMLRLSKQNPDLVF